MKNIIASGVLILLALMTMSTHKCNKNHIIKVDLKTVAESVNANATKAGETFEKTYTFKAGDEFKRKFGISPDAIMKFSVESFAVSFSQERCNDLASYSVVAQFPQLKPITVTNKCTFPSFNGSPAIIGFKRFNTQDPLYISVLDTDFALSIRQNKDIVITFKMVAHKDIPAGFGVVAALQATIEYDSGE
jgi:hypothetical protein